MHRIEKRRSWISKHLKIGFNYHHHHESPKMKSPSSSLRSYESAISNALSQLVSVIKSNPNIPSLAWAHEALESLTSIHHNLLKLTADSNYPFEKWSFGLTDEYLTHTLNLLDLLNSLTKNLSFIHQHMLPLLLNFSTSSMRPTTKMVLQNWLQFVSGFKAKDHDHQIQEEKIAIVAGETSEASEEETVPRKGMESAKGISLFLIKVLSFCFSGDFDSMLGMKVPLGHEWSVGLMDLQMKVCEEMLNRRTEKNGVGGLFFQEVVDVNEAVSNLLRYISSEQEESEEKTESVDNDGIIDDLIMVNILKGDVKEKVEILGGCLDALEMEVDRLFTLVLHARSQLLDALKRKDL